MKEETYATDLCLSAFDEKRVEIRKMLEGLIIHGCGGEKAKAE